jgi:hypothetical protein
MSGVYSSDITAKVHNACNSKKNIKTSLKTSIKSERKVIIDAQIPKPRIKSERLVKIKSMQGFGRR